MIRILNWLAGAVAVAILLGSTAAEAQRRRPGGEPAGRPDPAEMFERMDKNNDGSLTKEEMNAFFEKNGGRPDGPPRGDSDRRGPQDSRRADGPPHVDRDHRSPPEDRRDANRGPGGGNSRQADKSDRKRRHSGKGRGYSACKKCGNRSRGPSFSHHRRGPGGHPWIHRGPHYGMPFGRGHSFSHRGPGRPPMGPPWMTDRHSRGPHGKPGDHGKSPIHHHGPSHDQPDHDRRPGPDADRSDGRQRDGDKRPPHGHPGTRSHRPGPPPRGDDHADENRRPEDKGRPDRRETSLNAENEVNANTEDVEVLKEDANVAELEELAREIVTAVELPEIVPGMAVPDSPALPEDAAGNGEADNDVDAGSDSAIDTAAPVVALPEK